MSDKPAPVFTLPVKQHVHTSSGSLPYGAKVVECSKLTKGPLRLFTFGAFNVLGNINAHLPAPVTAAEAAEAIIRVSFNTEGAEVERCHARLLPSMDSERIQNERERLEDPKLHPVFPVLDYATKVAIWQELASALPNPPQAKPYQNREIQPFSKNCSWPPSPKRP